MEAMTEARTTAPRAHARIGALAVRHVHAQGSDSHAGARADTRFGRAFHWRQPAHLQQLFGRRAGDGQRLRGEIVEKQQGFQMQRLAGGFDGKRPMVVGHLHPIADDWVGNRHRGVAHGGNIVAA